MEKSSTPLDNSTNDVDIASADERDSRQDHSVSQLARYAMNALNELNAHIFTFSTY